MPIKFVIKFYFEKSVNILQISLDQIHALFFNIFPFKMAQELHKPLRFKPFCLWIPQIFSKNTENFQNHLKLSVSFLRNELFHIFVDGLMKKKDRLYLKNFRLRLSLRNSFLKAF